MNYTDLCFAGNCWLWQVARVTKTGITWAYTHMALSSVPYLGRYYNPSLTLVTILEVSLIMSILHTYALVHLRHVYSP